MDNVKYCGYCEHHFQKINKKLVKTIPAFRPTPTPAIEELSPSSSPDKVFSSSLTLKDGSKHQTACNSKGKGKRGRKPGSMIYEPKLEPPKFNPDLASLNSSNNSLNAVNNSVTLTPVSNFNTNHKVVNNSFSNSESLKIDKNLNDKLINKNSNVVVKIGKHGEVHHAKKDSPQHHLGGAVSPVDSDTILERVSGNIEVKEEVLDKKGFTTANFTESFIPSSSLSVTASLIKTEDTGRVKQETEDSPDTTMQSHGPPLAQYKADLKTNKSSQNNSFLAESQTNSSSGSNMFNRNSLSSSVSLFPTSVTGSTFLKSDSHNSQPHTTVSIIPSLTSNISSASSTSLSVSQVESTISSSSSHGISMAKIASKISEPVTISSVASSDNNRLTLETLNQSKNGAMLSPHNKVKVTNGPVKRMGRPPKKGTHTTTSSLGNVIHIDEGDEEAAGAGTKRARTEEVAGPEAVSEKAEGGSSSGLHKFMMFGATLNPASGMAKEMNTVLQVSLSTPISAKFILKFFQNEVAAHSVYSGEVSAQLVGVPVPGRRRTHDSGRAAPHTVAGMLDPARQPQTLEELLERHWEQGSRFLMEQASHFDIASLLSSLHQLKEENLGLEDSVDRLIARRDHLLAVRARLLALNSLTIGSLSQEPRRETVPLQNGPSVDRRPPSLVSPGRPLVSPSRDKPLPSPRPGPGPGPPLPSPRDRRELQSPRDRDRSPRLPGHLENGLEPGVGYRHERERLGNAQLLSVVHQHSNNSNHRQHSPVGMAGPPKAHYPHNNLPPGHPARHVELRGNYPANYQMVSPPPPKGQLVPPLPPHSSHLSRSTPPGMRNTPPGHPPPSHHGLPPEMHQHLIRASPQTSIHIKK